VRDATPAGTKRRDAAQTELRQAVAGREHEFIGVVLIGVGLLLAPITALVTDMSRVIKIALRMLFYLTPVLYAGNRIPPPFDVVVWLNPMTGVLEMLRAGFFEQPVVRGPIIFSAVITVALLFIGAFTFSRLERAVLKEI